ncbi:MAG: alpha-galactosidase [Planctomycetes bacterium]|nr:alpha-galactosidase [Planctomycetota bacterium]
MKKIAMIGAGSLVFCKTLSMDIMATEDLQDCEICLMSRTRPKLDRMERFLKTVVRENRLPTRISSTLDRREALDGADYVIVMIQVGGVEAFSLDYKIPLKYGVDQCIGDSLGPGGVFRGLRTIPVLMDIAKDMRALCPNAIMLNYANPMAACCFALGKAGNINFIGLCHGVQTTLDLISRYVNCPKDQIDFLCAGINHMAWFLSLRDRRDGRDLYGLFKRNCEKPQYYVNEKVRIEVMRHFGYFMTESTGHLSEYVPWFRSHKRSLDAYCDEPDFGGATGAYYKYSEAMAKKYKGVDHLAMEDAKISGRSIEYCSYILEAIETDKPFRLNGNVRNDGYITNLAPGCCVEVPVFVDGRGLHPVRVGDLPPQCAALNRSNVTVQELAVEAGLTGDPEYAMQAIAMDPLTAAVCTLHEARQMTAELLQAQRKWLPQFKGRTLAVRKPIKAGRNTPHVDVPLDPALAIVHRFGALAARKLPARKNT